MQHFVFCSHFSHKLNLVDQLHHADPQLNQHQTRTNQHVHLSSRVFVTCYFSLIVLIFPHD